MILLLTLCLWPPSPPLLSVVYDVEIFHDNRVIHAKMVLNRKSADHFSLHCRKAPSGTLFTYWATPEQDVLFLPKADMAFTGPAGQPFQLFPGGPELSRQDWLHALEVRPPDRVGSFRFSRIGDWLMLADTEAHSHVRWREKSRKLKQEYKPKVLQPAYREDTTVKPLAALRRFWTEDDLD